MNKALFLDRDGTINVEKNYLYKAEDFEFIEPTVKLCQKAQNKGYLLIVITNQSGVARGYYTENDMNSCNLYMINKFKDFGVEITDVFCCTSNDDNNPNRKPNSGMFLQAMNKYNIDMTNSISLGDKERDIIAAKNAGVEMNFLMNDIDKIGEIL